MKNKNLKRAEIAKQNQNAILEKKITPLSIYFCPCHDEVSENQLNLFSRISTIC